MPGVYAQIQGGIVLQNIQRNQAYEVEGACMKAQHKTLQDGTITGIEWILSQKIRKAEWRQQTPF